LFFEFYNHYRLIVCKGFGNYFGFISLKGDRVAFPVRFKNLFWGGDGKVLKPGSGGPG
jgi:hypothetical protein